MLVPRNFDNRRLRQAQVAVVPVPVSPLRPAFHAEVTAAPAGSTAVTVQPVIAADPAVTRTVVTNTVPVTPAGFAGFVP